ncbi:MAG: phosphoribosylamine--glycine ligase [Smithellaceae bacterium]|nr:phosphoribosylamine--glycine ligase [Smithellaceae bacterium]
MTRVLLIGNGAREHALAEAIMRSKRSPLLFAYMKANNPGIADLAAGIRLGSYERLAEIVSFARSSQVDFALVGPEDPLNNGVVDALREAGIPAVGPSRSLARLETSKSFTRDLLAKYGIEGNIRYKIFTDLAGVEEFLAEIPEVVIKPDGLTGGKGVLVQGEHFQTRAEALALCRQILAEHPRMIIEEKLDGEEFSLQCLCDGKHVVAMPAVQDHKRRFADDTGPNTGGMGSYSLADHALPFLTAHDIAKSLAITAEVASALYRETGEYYHGVMYGGFMVTKTGVRLLEYNARFGDPEAMNVLPLLKTDFVDLCQALIEGTLDQREIEWEKKATVCKYLVPKNYALANEDSPAPDKIVDLKIGIGETGAARIYYSSVDRRADGLYMTSSRAVGLVGIAETLAEAEMIAEKAAGAISGWVDHRRDIGTAPLIEKRMRHMERLGRKFDR